jgi:alkanesulfonate monooxygenase SsuD/methylene tetrahydromethanopterin reductase-like flavin-dependent oxidoreductase (luciferase family)
MQVGYATTFQNPDSARPDFDIWKEEVHLCDLVDKLGFDSIWSTEHHFTDYEMIPNPVQFLSYMAGRTKRAKLGTMVIVLPWHDPLRIAEEISVLDNLSEGRMILGIGRGVCAFEFDGLRIPMGESRDRFNQAAEIVLRALETGFVESDAEPYRIARRDIRPDPIYSFKGRTFGAGGSTESMPIMARLGAGLLIVPTKAWHKVEADVEMFRNAWKEFRPKEAVPQPLLDQFVFVHEDEERAKELAYKYIGSYFNQVLKHYNFAGAGLADTKGYEGYKEFTATVAANADKVVRDFVGWQAWGTPKQVTEKLAENRKRIDASTLLGHFCYGGMPLDVAEASVRLFAKEILPAVRDWVPDVFAKRTPLNLRAQQKSQQRRVGVA